MNNILPPERLVMASRESHPAMTQAKHIQKLLLGVDPYYKISILGMTILDDQLFDKRLSKKGRNRLFISPILKMQAFH
jgi:hydroxymethylbilane synthase